MSGKWTAAEILNQAALRIMNHATYVKYEEKKGLWSETRNPDSVNCKKFNDHPITSLKQWTEGYQWAMANHTVLEDGELFYTSSSTCRI